MQLKISATMELLISFCVFDWWDENDCVPLCGWQHFRKLVHILKSWFITLNIEITIRSVIMPQRQNEKDWFVSMQKLSQLNWHTFNYYNSRWQKIYLNISCLCICWFCGGIAQFPSYSGLWRGTRLFIPHRC